MHIEEVQVAPGVALAVRRWEGEATPFLLIHGLASNARTWDGVAAHLSARGHSVVAVDLRGHGQSDKPDGAYDFTTVTDDLAALIDAIGLDRPIAVGQSWGGNLVVELAWRFPALTRGIACIDGGLIELSRSFPDWSAAANALAPPHLEGTPRSEIERYVRSAHPGWPETGIEGSLANFAVRADGTVAPWLTRERHMAILRSLWDHHPMLRFSQLAVPALLVPADSGDAGRTAEKRRAIEEALASVPEGSALAIRVRWFAPADHDIHAQHPGELGDVLHDAAVDGFFR